MNNRKQIFSLLFWLTAIVGLVVGSAGVANAQGSIPTEANLKVAFIGDSGKGSGHRSVLDLIARQNPPVDLVLHQGDNAYSSSGVTEWKTNITDRLNIPYIGSEGNHDAGYWSDYATFYNQQMSTYGISGSNPSTDEYEAEYKGLKMVFTGNEKSEATSHIDSVLSGDNHIWKICSWHKNQSETTPGPKSDGYVDSAFEKCRMLGALILNGHAHVYGRSKTITEFIGDLTVDPTCDGDDVSCVAPGKTVVIDSSLGGKKRNLECSKLNSGWWASAYGGNGRYDSGGLHGPTNTCGSGSGAYGALFITFNYDGDPNRAHGVFKDVNDQIIDTFDIYASGVAVTPSPGASPTPTSPPTSTATPTQPPSPKDPDINADGSVDRDDMKLVLSAWRGSGSCGTSGQFDCDIHDDGKVNSLDAGIVTAAWGGGGGGGAPPTPTPRGSFGNCGGGGCNLDHSVCDEPYVNSGGPGHDTSHITNQWLPYNRENSPSMINVLRNGDTVQMSVLTQDTDICTNVNNTIINGVKVQVMEERESRTGSGNLFEVSCNYFAQAPDGTVCYYGEYVDDGQGNPIGGGWIAGQNGANAGIMMPANPAVGQRFMIEDAPNASEDGYIETMGSPYYDAFMDFLNTMYVVEDHGHSNKRYAPCYGMITDEGMKITSTNLISSCSN